MACWLRRSEFQYSMDVPCFSVLTVTRNAESLIAATAESIRCQGAQLCQWIVKDGASNDATVEIARRYSPDIMLSDTDCGIYDAMNQAAALATGDWLFFLNAGDAFVDPAVLADIAQAAAADPQADIVFGDVLYVGTAGTRRKRFHWLTRKRLLFGDLCHQAVFVRRDLFSRVGPFDATLRWNADFDWFVRAFRAGARLRYISRDIARFDDSGAHVQAGVRCEVERDAVRARYLPLPLWRLGNLALRVEFRLRRLAGQTV